MLRLILAVLVVACSTPALAQTFARSYAIVVGIDAYKNSKFPALSNGVVDAERVAEYLKREGYEVTLLTDAKATRAHIIGALRQAARELGASDRLIFFFGGHGFTEKLRDQEVGYIVPVDAEGTESFISMDDMRAESERLREVRHQLFIMNSCHGGTIGILPTRSIGVDQAAGNYLQEIARRPARQFITAGGPEQEVLDGGPGGLSYFAYYFLEATARGEADLNRDGTITFAELAAYLVPRASNKLQTPAYGMLPGHAMGEYVFTAAKQDVAASSPPQGSPAPARPDRPDPLAAPVREPPPAVTTTASTDLSAVAVSFAEMQRPIDDLYTAWRALDLKRYLGQWAPDAVQYVGSKPRSFADIKRTREALFPRLAGVDVERYQLWYRGFRNGVGHFDASYAMTFRFKDGRVIRERERESYKVRRAGGRWVIVENQDYKR
jgi:hypothetical protein